MPHLIGLVLVGGALWAGYRWLRKETVRIQADLRDADERLERRDDRAIPTLRRDPRTGVYRPVDD